MTPVTGPADSPRWWRPVATASPPRHEFRVQIPGRRFDVSGIFPNTRCMHPNLPLLATGDALLLVRRVHVDFLRMHICGC